MARTSAGTTVADRQRDRNARGIGTRDKPSGPDRPAPPRRRRPALAAIALLLIVGGAALAGLLALRLDSRVPVLALAQDVPAGTEITQTMLTTTDVASDGLRLVPEADISQVLGTYTTIPLAQGQLLETAALTQAAPIGDDQAQVGVPLELGRTPEGLRSGDLVRLVRIGDGNSAPVAISTGLVLTTSSDTTGGTLGGTGSEDTQGSTVLVPSVAADAAVDAAANERLGMSLLQRGVSVDGARLVVLGANR